MVFPEVAAVLAVVAREGAGDMKHQEFLEQIQDKEIVAAIRAAESLTSGEIRVFVSRKAVEDPLEAGRAEFERMGMTKTAGRNAILIYVAPLSQRFAVLGDLGIHEKCGASFWTEVTEEMAVHFRKSDFTGGIVCAIQKSGSLLAVHFPRQSDDGNELPDSVERG